MLASVLHRCMPICMYTCVYVCTCVCVCVCVCVYIHKYIYINTYTYIHIHVHTHIHLHLQYMYIYILDQRVLFVFEDSLSATHLHLKCQSTKLHTRRSVQIRCTWRFSTQSHPAKRNAMSSGGDSSPARWGGRRRTRTRKSLRRFGWKRSCTI